jgi:hypothetical protein
MNKEAIMARLAAGESLQAIGDEFAAMMNAAADEYNEAKRKEAEEAARAAAENAKVLNEKRTLALNFIETLKRYCAISGVDPKTLGENDLDDMDMLVEAMDELMDLMKSMNELKSKLDLVHPIKPLKVSSISMPVVNDDEILKSFIKGL